VKVENIKDYDLSAKNPNKAKEEKLRSPEEIIENIEKNDEEIKNLVKDLKLVLDDK
jgi:type I restriction enzyme M protein